MLKFEEVVNIREEITKGLNSEDYLKGTGEILDTQSIELIGRERDSRFTFRYESVSQRGTQSRRTHLGVCNLANKRVRTLYSFSNTQDVTQCTLSDHNSLLVFCIMTDPPLKVQASLSKEYRMYVSEIQEGPRHSGNPVAIKFSNLDKAKSAQFIHTDSSTPQSQHKLLVFDHGESVGVCNFHLDSVGKFKEKVRFYEPSLIGGIGKLLWFQWDIDLQKLFVISKPKGGSVMDVYEPSERTTLDHLFSLPFNIDAPFERPRVPQGTIEQRSTERNIVVLSSRNGILCICNQVPYPGHKTRPSGDSFPLVYEIICLHQGAKIAVKIPTVLVKLKKRCIYFDLLGTYVLAYLPGVFTHLINVNERMEPGVLNILSAETASINRVPDNPEVFSRVQLTNAYERPRCVLLYEKESMAIYRASINEDALVNLFKAKWSAEVLDYPLIGYNKGELTNQLAVLQYAMANTLDPTLMKQLLGCFKEDATSYDTSSVLVEYILGSAFIQFGRYNQDKKLDSFLSPLMKYTGSKERRSHRVQLDPGPEYTVTITAINPREGERMVFHSTLREDSYFLNFSVRVTRIHESKCRFILPSDWQESDALEGSSSKLESSRTPGGSVRRMFSGLFRKSRGTSNTYVSSEEVRSSLESTSLDSFPDCLVEERTTSVEELYIKKVTEKLENHVKTYYERVDISSNFSSQYKKQAKSVHAKLESYVRGLVNNVKLLLYHLYKVLGLEEQENKQYSITKSKDKNDSDLKKSFYILERYQLAVNKLGIPVPKEFPTILTTLAFQSFNATQFLQYLDSGIIVITDEFLEMLDKDTSAIELKNTILSRLSEELAMNWSLKHHSSPAADAKVVKLPLEKIFEKYGNKPTSPHPEKSDYEHEVTAYKYLVRSLYASGWTPGQDGVTQAMLDDAIFYHTKKDYEQSPDC